MQLQSKRCCWWRHFHANSFNSTFCVSCVQTPAFKVEWHVGGVRHSYAIKPLCPNECRLGWLWWGILAAEVSRSQCRVQPSVPRLFCWFSVPGGAHAELQENWELFLSVIPAAVTLIYLSQIAQQVCVCSPARAPGSWSRRPPARINWDPRCRVAFDIHQLQLCKLNCI